MSPTMFWVLAIILFAVVEALTVGLTSIWIGVGALASLLVSFLTGNLWIQAIVFLVVSFLALVAFKPLAARYLSAKSHQPTNADRIVGQEAVVTEEICNLESRGRVQVLGQEWSARSTDEQIIPAKAVVVVDRIEGVKVFVTKKIQY